jgi:hypothetical protein
VKDIVYDNGNEIGRIVKRVYRGKYFHWDTGVEVINIPKGKMWTLLYFELSRESTVPMIRIYPVKYGNSWGRDDYYSFNVPKESFISVKYSKQQSNGKNGQNDHLRPEQKDHPLAGAN